MSQQTTPTLPHELPAELLSETFLLAMMNENLNQARHAENERMMFVTLFAALVGGMLAVASEVGNDFFSTIIILLLFVLNTVCSCLTRRWNFVFKTHWSLPAASGAIWQIAARVSPMIRTLRLSPCTKEKRSGKTMAPALTVFSALTIMPYTRNKSTTSIRPDCFLFSTAVSTFFWDCH